MTLKGHTQKKWDREPLTNVEVDKCIDACKTLEERVMVCTLADTGCRKNEVLRMRKEWIRFKKGLYGQMTIPVRDDYKPVPEGSRRNADGTTFKPRGPKTKVARRVALTERLSGILREFFRDNEQLYRSGNWAYVLCARVGKAAGIEKRVTPHIFRHSWISNAFAAGVNTTRIGKRVGHIDSHMVEAVYLHIDDDATDAELEAGGMLDR